MQRDWDSEWAVLSDAERAAFKALSKAQAELTGVFARYGAPDLELLGRVEKARATWEAAKAKNAQFIADFRKAA
jgi:hypothetical protein